MEATVVFFNAIKIYQLKAKDSKLNACPMCLENILKDFAADNMKQTRVNGYVYHVLLIMEALMLIIFWISINILMKWDNIK